MTKRGSRQCIVYIGLMLSQILHAQQQNPASLAFEVATIKPADPNATVSMIRPRPAGDGYTAQNTTLKVMISVAYRIPKNQITGGPDWMDTEHYNLEAKADHAYGLEDLHIMLQHLLADRFHLVFHKETREGPVYALVVDASGVKMTPDGDQPDLNIPIGLPNHGVFTGTKVSMAYLCYWLGLQVPGDRQRPVIDRTGLKQVYDFKLSFVPDLPPNMTREQLPPELQNLPFLPDALREQLGLRLEAQKRTGRVLRSRQGRKARSKLSAGLHTHHPTAAAPAATGL